MIDFSPISKRTTVLRFSTEVSLDEIARLAQQIREQLDASDEPCIFAADWRMVPTFPPEIASALIELMRSDNPRICRTGILVARGSNSGDQIEEILAAAGNPARHSFRDTEALLEWLGQVISDVEAKTVRRCLGA